MSNLRISLGIIEEEDQKQAGVYQHIQNLLCPTVSSMRDANQSEILRQLDNFHRYYQQKQQEGKDKYEKIKNENWVYASRIVKYEQALHGLERQKLESSQRSLQQQRKIAQLIELLKAKDQQITDLQGELGRTNIKQGTVRKVVRLKQRSIRIDNEQENLESARSQRQMNYLKREINDYAMETQQMMAENQALKKRVKHLETDRRYQDERLRNATLSLQLDLKIRDEQIERLNFQIRVYQRKFHELIQSFRNKSLPNRDKQKLDVNDFEQQNQPQQGQWKNVELRERNLDQQGEGEKTHRKIEIAPASCEGRLKTHKRHGSSNLEEYRKESQKEGLNMKIKVLRCSNRGVKHP